MTRVRFPPPAPHKRQSYAHIAQSVEHFLGKEEVTGSNPVMSSMLSVKICDLAESLRQKVSFRLCN